MKMVIVRSTKWITISVREGFKDEQVKGNRDRALEILGLINKALNKTKAKIKTVLSNKNFLDNKE